MQQAIGATILNKIPWETHTLSWLMVMFRLPRGIQEQITCLNNPPFPP